MTNIETDPGGSDVRRQSNPTSDSAVETTGLVSQEDTEFAMTTSEAAVILAKAFVGAGWLSLAFGVKEVSHSRMPPPSFLPLPLPPPSNTFVSHVPPHRRIFWGDLLEG